MSVSTSLGQPREVHLSVGTVHYREVGEGPVLLFVHGALINGDVWGALVSALADSYRCVTPDLPLGGHHPAMKPDADLSPRGIARLIVEFIRELGLEDVTLVSNDTGTAFTQLVLADQPGAVSRAVLTTGDAFQHFPPLAFSWLIALAYIPGALWAQAQLMRSRAAQRIGFRPLTRSELPDWLLESWTGPARRDPAVRRDVGKLLRAIRPRYTQQAASQLSSFHGPVLIAWSKGARIFPAGDADRLRRCLGGPVRLEMVAGARTYLPLDQPQALGSLIREFLSEAASGP